MFVGIVVLFLIFTSKRPYDNKTFQLSGQKSFVAQSSVKETTEKQDRSFFSLSLPSFFSDDKDRIINDNCGISFKIPNDWTLFSVEEGDRFCNYYIKNPHKRGATLQLGVPFSPSMKETVEWNEFIQYMSATLELKTASVPHADEAYQTERIVYTADSGELTGVGDPMYIFRKDQAVYFIRYGYVDDDGRNMLDDISSVVSSIKFQKDKSFYGAPLRSTP